MARTLSQGWRGKLFYRGVTCGLASQSAFLSSLAIWVRLHSIFQAPAPKDSNLVAWTSMGDMKWGFQHPWYQYSFHVPGPLGSFCDSSEAAVCDRSHCPLTSFHTCLYMHYCDPGWFMNILSSLISLRVGKRILKLPCWLKPRRDHSKCRSTHHTLVF